MKLFTNEIVFRGHPDKVADQISDALVMEFVKDESDRAAIETVGGKGIIFITGEVRSSQEVDVESVTKAVLRDVGYPDDVKVIDNIGVQSADIARGVDIGGAGDQGVMFGYAVPTESGVPYTQELLQDFAEFYDNLRKLDSRFLPDGKAQITALYEEDGYTSVEIVEFVVSYQNTEVDREETDRMLAEYINENSKIPVNKITFNPTGKFKVGGFEGDAGLTGRKVIVDTYHGFARHGGGAFSGKDLTKVDRSGAYAAREIAIELSRKYSRPVEVQLSYAIGMPNALSIWTSIGDLTNNPKYKEMCKVENLVKRYADIDLRETSKFGHFGRGIIEKERYDGE